MFRGLRLTIQQMMLGMILELKARLDTISMLGRRMILILGLRLGMAYRRHLERRSSVRRSCWINGGLSEQSCIYPLSRDEILCEALFACQACVINLR
jgi:hypothetical protein